MKINLSSFYNFTISSLKEKILPPLTPHQKIISLIALAALASLALGYLVCYVVYRNVKKSDLPKEKKGDIQNNENPQPEPIKVKEPEVQVKEGEVGKELKNEDLIRIAYQQLWGGIEMKNRLTESQIELLTKHLKDSITTRLQQKEFGNKNPSLFYVDYNDFGVKNGIDIIGLEALIRYFILKGEAFAYSRAGAGYCLYLNKESHDKRKHDLHETCYTKQKLEKADAYVESLIFPPLDAYHEKQNLANKAVKEIRNEHYRRVLEDRVQNKSCDLYIPLYPNCFLTPLMDKLVEQGLIHSWNTYQRMGTITAKIKAEDLIDEQPSMYQWKLWRDAQEIEREVQFRKENCVSVSAQTLLASGLSTGEQDDLQKLLEDLNKRTHPGPFDFRGKYQTNKILDFLKAEKAIFDYKRNGWQNDFIIFIKATDLPNAVK